MMDLFVDKIAFPAMFAQSCTILLNYISFNIETALAPVIMVPNLGFFPKFRGYISGVGFFQEIFDPHIYFFY